jgi:hypothetical protein
MQPLQLRSLPSACSRYAVGHESGCPEHRPWRRRVARRGGRSLLCRIGVPIGLVTERRFGTSDCRGVPACIGCADHPVMGRGRLSVRHSRRRPQLHDRLALGVNTADQLQVLLRRPDQTGGQPLRRSRRDPAPARATSGRIACGSQLAVPRTATCPAAATCCSAQAPSSRSGTECAVTRSPGLTPPPSLRPRRRADRLHVQRDRRPGTQIQSPVRANSSQLPTAHARTSIKTSSGRSPGGPGKLQKLQRAAEPAHARSPHRWLLPASFS